MARAAIVFLLLSAGSHKLHAADVTFERDVMAVFSKAGCNAGTCHGNKNGKGGFRLSLRGEDPVFDYQAVTRGLSGRRVNSTNADASLLLLKPTMQVPHQGGRRFHDDSVEYQILKQWIEAGCPPPVDISPLKRLRVGPRDVVVHDPHQHVSVSVIAEFRDGTEQDVTRLATYEPAEPNIDVSVNGVLQRLQFGQSVVNVRYLTQQVPVRVAFVPRRPDYQWSGPDPVNFIDVVIFNRLKALKRNPAPVCDAVTFLRRAHLDLTGLLPDADVARDFVADQSTDKRQRLVDRLLDSPEFVDCQAQKWCDLLRVEEKTLDRKGVQSFHAWIRHAISTGQPLNEFVRELITSRGSSYAHPASNYYRAMRTPEMRAESTAQLFLGVRLACAKCHNHPFDRWTQNDYYGWGNLFARVEYEIVSNNRRDRNDKHEFDGEQIVWLKRDGDFAHPSGNIIAPRFLSDSLQNPTKQADRLESLATWLTSPNNRRFVLTQANRIWAQLLGRGIVDPIDDFRSTNPPSHPELLKALGDEFVAHDFDVRHLIRTIMASQTYQLSSTVEASDRDAPLFSHGIERRLSAEQLADALSQVSGVAIEFNGYPIGIRAHQIPGVRALRSRDRSPSEGDKFLTLFGKPPRLQSCECERSEESTLAQAFQLVSGPLLNDLLAREDNRIATLLASPASDAQVVDELFWTALSRAPTLVEIQGTVEFISAARDRRQAYEDLAWSLANSAEFLLRR